MSDFIYSPSLNLFYDKTLKDEYNNSGLWPGDGIDVSDDVFFTYTGSAPDGKIRICGDDNLPTWGEIPAPTEQEQIEQAESQRGYLRANADSEIDWRQDAVDAGIATEEETAALAEWKKYRVLLMRVDTADPDWPTLPETEAS
ncbi:TPA: tail fiber assembly protein [Escherichia coli]|nr:tail fiber assembly protein [Escherichia coli]